MIYKIVSDGVQICDKSAFNPKHILECGQVFSYRKTDDGYEVFPQDKYAKIVENENGYKIITTSPDYFIQYFDLNTDYGDIKNRLSKFDIMKKPLEFGSGIRILKQDLFEMLISFIISANNNIKRIQVILERMRAKLGKKTAYGYAFPSIDALKSVDQDFFVSIGAGYRAKYLFGVIRQISTQELESLRSLPTDQLRKKLLSLLGVGPKVADCILLFGYGRGDVFPVDTWIEQMYEQYYSKGLSRDKIRENLVKQFGALSGYAQQYLFYYQRSKQ